MTELSTRPAATTSTEGVAELRGAGSVPVWDPRPALRSSTP